jgi:hypothetical protein
MRYLYTGLPTSIQIPTDDGGVKDVMLSTNTIVELPSDFDWVKRHAALGYLEEVPAEPQQTAKSKSKESA